METKTITEQHQQLVSQAETIGELGAEDCVLLVAAIPDSIALESWRPRCP